MSAEIQTWMAAGFAVRPNASGRDDEFLASVDHVATAAESALRPGVPVKVKALALTPMALSSTTLRRRAFRPGAWASFQVPPDIDQAHLWIEDPSGDVPGFRPALAIEATWTCAPHLDGIPLVADQPAPGWRVVVIAARRDRLVPGGADVLRRAVLDLFRSLHVVRWGLDESIGWRFGPERLFSPEVARSNWLVDGYRETGGGPIKVEELQLHLATQGTFEDLPA